MKNFLLALQFLTIIPVKIKGFQERKTAEAIIYFPVVGLLLGLGLAGTNKILCILGFQQWVTNIILVILLAILTGGLHLDGLADTCDALFSRKNKTEMLEIMRDSRIGTMGVLSLISVVLLKIAFLSSLPGYLIGPSIVSACVLSRWSMPFSMFLFPYARQEGKAKFFIQGINIKIFMLSTLIALSCVILIWNLKGLLLILITAAAAYAIGNFTNKKIGGITGDTIGAASEIMEVAILFTISIM